MYLLFRGHNEIDDPTFTNPRMYKVIHERETVPNLYKNKLIEEEIIGENDVKQFEEEYMECLVHELSKSNEIEPSFNVFGRNWANLQQAGDEYTTMWDTGSYKCA